MTDTVSGPTMEDRTGPLASDGSGAVGPAASLLLIVGEPFEEGQRELILERAALELAKWDSKLAKCEIDAELAALVQQNVKPVVGPGGESLIGFKSERCTIAILINPRLETLVKSLKSSLLNCAKYHHLIYAGSVFGGISSRLTSSSWLLQDACFTFNHLSTVFKSVVSSFTKDTVVDLSAPSDGSEFTSGAVAGLSSVATVRLNVLPAAEKPLKSFIDSTISPLIKDFDLTAELPVSHDTERKVAHTQRPTLHVFPAGQGNSSMFGVDGFNMLINAGYMQKPSCWNYIRQISRFDALIISQFGPDNIFGVRNFLKRKATDSVVQQLADIGVTYCNAGSAAHEKTSFGDLVVNGGDLVSEIVGNLEKIHCPILASFADDAGKPVNIYHKVGSGSLDMFVLAPTRAGLPNGKHSARGAPNEKPALPGCGGSSIASVVVWKSTRPGTDPVRILFLDNTPQQKLFEGLDKLKTEKLFLSWKGVEKRAQCVEKKAPGITSTSKHAEPVKSHEKTTGDKAGKHVEPLKGREKAADLKSGDKTNEEASKNGVHVVKQSSKAAAPSNIKKAADSLDPKTSTKAATASSDVKDAPKSDQSAVDRAAKEKGKVALEQKTIKKAASTESKEPLKKPASAAASKKLAPVDAGLKDDKSVAKKPVEIRDPKKVTAKETKKTSVDDASAESKGVNKPKEATAKPEGDVKESKKHVGAPKPAAGGDGPQKDGAKSARAAPTAATTAVKRISHAGVKKDGHHPVLNVTTDGGEMKPPSATSTPKRVKDDKNKATAKAGQIVPATTAGINMAGGDANEPTGTAHEVHVAEPSAEHPTEFKLEADPSVEMQDVNIPVDAVPQSCLSGMPDMAEEPCVKTEGLVGGLVTNDIHSESTDAENVAPAVAEHGLSYGTEVTPAAGDDDEIIKPVDVDYAPEEGIEFSGLEADIPENTAQEEVQEDVPEEFDEGDVQSHSETDQEPSAVSDQPSTDLPADPAFVDNEPDEKFDPEKEWEQPHGLPSPTLLGEEAQQEVVNASDAASATANTNNNEGEAAESKINAVDGTSRETSSTDNNAAAASADHPAKPAAGNKPAIAKASSKPTSAKTGGKAAVVDRLNATTIQAPKPTTTVKKGRMSLMPGELPSVTSSNPSLAPLKAPTATSKPLSATAKKPNITSKPQQPFYVDSAFVPNCGSSTGVTVEFFQRVRARYYILSAACPDPKVVQMVLDAKGGWDGESDVEVTVIPTHDSEELLQWILANEDLLGRSKVTVAPSASRCTLQVGDDGSVCNCYRVEF